MFVLVGKVSKYLFVGVDCCMFMGLPLPNDVEPKALSVLPLCFKTYENRRFWETEDPKALTVLLLCFKTKPVKTVGVGRSKSQNL